MKKEKTMNICTECNKKVEHRLARGKCKTCYAREYRKSIATKEVVNKGVVYRKEYRELNKERINKYWRNKRSINRKYQRDFQAKHGLRKTKPRSEEYKAKVLKTYQEVSKYKMEKGCIDCGYNKHFQALDFDHRSDKLHNISTLARSNSNPKTLWDEIAKCDVRCANCHRIVTYNRRVELKNAIAN
jgi:hypothetical protein